MLASLCEQMDSSDNLFDFDVEVKPLLSVLVGKTLAQALVEVKEEQEMEFIQHQRKIMHAEKAENAREDKLLEEKSKQLQLEKEQEKQAKALKLRRRQVVTEKLMAWQLSRQIVDRSMELCTTALERKGVFYDPIQRDLAQWLASDIYKGADAKIRLQAAAYTLLDGRYLCFVQLVLEASLTMRCAVPPPQICLITAFSDKRSSLTFLLTRTKRSCGYCCENL